MAWRMGARGVSRFFEPHRDDDRAGHGDDDSAPGLDGLPAALLQRHGARVLYPADAAAVPGWPAPRSTVYRARTLMVPGDLVQEPTFALMNRALARVGMRMVPPGPDGDTAGRGGAGDGPAPGATPNGHGPSPDVLRQLPRTAVLVPAASADGMAAPPVVVDAWVALQMLRAAASAGGRCAEYPRRPPDLAGAPADRFGDHRNPDHRGESHHGREPDHRGQPRHRIRRCRLLPAARR